MADIINIWNDCLGIPENEGGLKITISLDQLRTLIEKTTPLIGHEVLLNDNTISLDWPHLEKYIDSTISKAGPLHDFLHTHIVVTLYRHVRNIQHRSAHALIFFDAPQHARAYNQFLLHILPIKNPDFPRLKEKQLTITSDQFHFINRLSMLRAESLPAEFFKDCFLKTLRADTMDFTSTFLTTLFNTHKDNRALQNLRPVNRGAYIIHPDGTLLHRHKRVSNNGVNKNGFTQIQSLTLIDDWLLSPAFGHLRRDTLYGLVTHHSDVRISRLLKTDGGTIGRPFETDSPFTAGQQLRLLNQKDRHFSENQLSEFKRAVVNERLIDSKTNEVLARMRFNPHKSFVAICSNTLSSRLLAYDFAQELLESVEQNNGVLLNQSFKLPVVFYNKPAEKSKSFLDRFNAPNKQHEISLYTSEMRIRDLQQCDSIFNDKTKRLNDYKKHNFDFLLGLNKLTLNIFLEEVEGTPLALYMLQKGYARALVRVLRPLRLKKLEYTDPNLLHIIFKNLLDRNLIQKNDPIIAELIRIEAFELADILIKATNSEKNKLKFRIFDLVDYLAEKGNPRQIKFMGLSEMLTMAAVKKYWVTIRLCLKEIKEIDSILLEYLFLEAFKQGQHSETILLEKPRTANNDGIISLQDKVSSNPFIDPQDPIKSVCILVFEAYILGEKKLAEWRLFHYGREINIIPNDGDKKFTYGFKLLLTSFERALPFLHFDSSNHAHKLAAEIFLYYKDTDLYLSLRELINSRLKPADLPTEKAIATKLIDSLNPISSNFPMFIKPLKRVISQSNHLHIWLLALTETLTKIIDEKYTIKFHHALIDYNTLELEELFELFIFALDCINSYKTTYIDDDIRSFIDIKNEVNIALLLAYKTNHFKTLHAILSTPFIIEKSYNETLNYMIENIVKSPSIRSLHLHSQYLRQLLEDHPIKVKAKHIQLALYHKNQWQIIPLLESIDECDIQNPDNFWEYYELWRIFKFDMILRPKEQSDALACKLGPLRTRHYSLLYIILVLCKLFENQHIFSSYFYLNKPLDSEPTRKIINDLKSQTIASYNNSSIMFETVLKLLDDYLSALTTIESLPCEQLLLNIYKNLLAHFESTISRSSLSFFRKQEEKDIISDFYKIVSETDQIFNQSPSNNNPETHIQPDPSDITLYL
ncbi:MAG: hypothetical protein K2X50_00370 [Gammaproteobacteria bacterium]|nr:hypothetical protein [Gammaproteobacteria bacterium]